MPVEAPPAPISTSARPSWRQLIVEPTGSTAIQFIRYIFAGGFAFVLDFGSLYLLTSRVGLHYLISAALSFLLGLVANYLLSRAWVFPRRAVRGASLEFAIFTAIGLIGLGLNEFGIWLLSAVLGLHYMVSKACTSAAVFFWNFTARKVSLFR